jgi:phosphatidylethanolamine-binding protein (PEBP) family uncharacterized protein
VLEVAVGPGVTNPRKEIVETQSVPNPISPKLEWTNAAANTVRFAWIFHDPEVSMQKRTDDFLRRGAFNIPGTASGLPEGVPLSRNCRLLRARSTPTARQRSPESQGLEMFLDVFWMLPMPCKSAKSDPARPDRPED